MRAVFGATWHHTIKNVAWALSLAAMVASLAWCTVRERELATVDLADRIVDDLEGRINSARPNP